MQQRWMIPAFWGTERTDGAGTCEVKGHAAEARRVVGPQEINAMDFQSVDGDRVRLIDCPI